MIVRQLQRILHLPRRGKHEKVFPSLDYKDPIDKSLIIKALEWIGSNNEARDLANITLDSDQTFRPLSARFSLFKASQVIVDEDEDNLDNYERARKLLEEVPYLFQDVDNIPYSSEEDHNIFQLEKEYDSMSTSDSSTKDDARLDPDY
jgi:hypothetical protein